MAIQNKAQKELEQENNNYEKNQIKKNDQTRI